MTRRPPYEWTGPEWQEYCEQLLIRKYPGHFARMPDTDDGDLGIEGYATDGSGTAYQCYAPQAIETKKRAAAQCQKMTADLKKLDDKSAEVARHLGDVKIKVWVLLTPEHDSRAVTAHARKKELEVRSKGLSFVDEEFVIDIQTDHLHFAAEIAQLDEVGAVDIRFPEENVAESDIELDAEEQPELLENVTRKVRVALPDAGTDQLAKLVDRLQRYAIHAMNVDEDMRVNYPTTWERYQREKLGHEQKVSMNSLMGEEQSIRDVRERFEESLRREVNGLRHGPEATELAYGAVADWLRRCPLDFLAPGEAA